ncbi:MAG: T9SS type A sorting domain-containing protein, partial [Saprospiraceae bacterium]|nr:T9SS type A sorting domain-containing protein [Saprospiraceae bacterium]
EFSGFVWFQGWNDGANDDFLNAYESNLYHLVNDVRNELDKPDLPVVIASSGQGGFEVIDDLWVQSMQNIVSVAQQSVGCNDSVYGGQVGFVDTKPYYRNLSASPEDAIYHFNNNALTFLNTGKAMGDEMILAINDMAFCHVDCADPVSPGIVSVGNRVWNDLNHDGKNDPDEPGIPGVSLVIWSDSDGDDIPDWQGFGGVRVTDENGYYRFSGLQPGNYVVFVWSVNNWGPGEPLENFISTNGFQANANDDVDLDNNGFGNPFSDIMSGIMTLTSDEEPLNDGDPTNCYFNYDASGNNTVDFGFYDPTTTTAGNDPTVDDSWIQIFPMPVLNAFTIKGNLSLYQIEIYDAVGRTLRKIDTNQSSYTVDVSSFPAGLYFVKTVNQHSNHSKMFKIVKQ